MPDQLPLQWDNDDDDPLNQALRDLFAEYGYPRVARALAYLLPSTGPVPSAPARTTDPVTSHAAAKQEVDVGRFSSRANAARLLEEFGKRPLTDQEATQKVFGPRTTVSQFEGTRRRCSDLRAAGYLYDTGKRRKNTGSDDDSIVWDLTENGRVALANLALSGWSR